MQKKGHKKQQGGLPAFSIEDLPDGQQNHRCRQGARMQMLVHHVQRRSRYRKREHGRDHRDSTPSRSLFAEKLPRDLFHRPQY
jgi:hypothetical protein